jgi:hypothetical protein
MKLLKYLSIFFIIFSTSCLASKNSYIEPENPNAFYPTIKAYMYRDRISKFDNSDLRTNVLWGTIEAIDGKPINYGWLNGFDRDNRFHKQPLMTPGQHIISIEAYIAIWKNNSAITSSNQINLSVKTKLGCCYQPQVRLIGNNIKVWIQDQTGKISSQILVVPQHII